MRIVPAGSRRSLAFDLAVGMHAAGRTALNLEVRKQVKVRAASIRTWLAHLATADKLYEAYRQQLPPANTKRCASTSLVLADFKWDMLGSPPMLATGMPAAPVKWQALPSRRIGLGFTSAVRAANELAAAAQREQWTSAQVQAVDAGDGFKKLRSVAALAHHPRPAYVRINVLSARIASALAHCAMGETTDGLDSVGIRLPLCFHAAGAGIAGRQVCTHESPLQFWLNFEERNAAVMHTDAPDSMLLCLGGTKQVALLPPAAPGKLGVPTCGSTKLTAAYDPWLDATAIDAGVCREVSLSAGDALYIPSGWWHAVRSSKDAVALAMPVSSQL